MIMRTIQRKLLEQIQEKINWENVEIYLRPKANEFGATGAASTVARITDGELEVIEDVETNGKYIISRCWFEIMMIINGTFAENDKLELYEEDESAYYYAREYGIHIPIGKVTGYLIDKEDFAYDKEYEMSAPIKFDCISQIVSDLWCEINADCFDDLILEYNDYILDDEKYCVYYLDEIFYEDGFVDNRIDKAVIRLLPSAIRDYTGKCLEDMIYEPFRRELGDDSYEPTPEFYEKRTEMLKDEGFEVKKSKFGSNVYFHKHLKNV